MPAGLPSDEELLHAEVCPTCGYSLTGHDADGVCPECGQHYGRSLVVLYGWGCGNHATLTNCSPASLLGTSVLFGLFVLGIGAHSVGGGLVLLLAGAFAGLEAWWQRRQPTLYPGRVQVWLDARGCGQRDNPTVPSAWGLISSAIHWVAVIVTGALLIRWWAGGPTHWVPLVAVAGYAVARQGRVLRRWITHAKTTTSGCILSPWSSMHEISVSPEGKDRHRLHLRCVSVWLFSHEPVDAEVACDKRQAEELRRRIEAWRAAAKDAAI